MGFSVTDYAAQQKSHDTTAMPSYLKNDYSSGKFSSSPGFSIRDYSAVQTFDFDDFMKGAENFGASVTEYYNSNKDKYNTSFGQGFTSGFETQKKRANAAMNYLDYNRELLTDESYNNAKNWVQSYINDLGAWQSAYRDVRDVFGSFKNENEYKTEKRKFEYSTADSETLLQKKAKVSDDINGFNALETMKKHFEGKLMLKEEDFNKSAAELMNRYGIDVGDYKDAKSVIKQLPAALNSNYDRFFLYNGQEQNKRNSQILNTIIGQLSALKGQYEYDGYDVNDFKSTLENEQKSIDENLSLAYAREYDEAHKGIDTLSKELADMSAVWQGKNFDGYRKANTKDGLYGSDALYNSFIRQASTSEEMERGINEINGEIDWLSRVSKDHDRTSGLYNWLSGQRNYKDIYFEEGSLSYDELTKWAKETYGIDISGIDPNKDFYLNNKEKFEDLASYIKPFVKQYEDNADEGMDITERLENLKRGRSIMITHRDNLKGDEETAARMASEDFDGSADENEKNWVYREINSGHKLTAEDEVEAGQYGNWVVSASNKYNKYYALTDNEIAVFNDIWRKEGEEAAMEYFDLLSVKLNSRINDVLQEYNARYAKEHKVMSTIETFATVIPNDIAAIIGNTRDFGKIMKGEGIDAYDEWKRGNISTQTIRSTIASNLGSIGRVFYNGLTSGVDNGIRLVFAASVGAGLGLQGAALSSFASGASSFMMGNSVMQSGIIQGIEKGYDDKSAFIYGLAQGGIEFLTEKYSIDSILGSIEKGTLVSTLAKSFVSEGSEEVASNIANRIVDLFADGENADLIKRMKELEQSGYSKSKAFSVIVGEMAAEDAESFFSGGIGGLFMGGASKLSSVVTGKNLNIYGEEQQNNPTQERLINNRAVNDGVGVSESGESSAGAQANINQNSRSGQYALNNNAANQNMAAFYDNAMTQSNTSVNSSYNIQENAETVPRSTRYQLNSEESNSLLRVEENILENVPQEQQLRAVKEYLAEQNPGGIEIDGNINIDARSVKESTYSQYIKSLNNAGENVDSGSLKAADNARGAPLAPVEYVNEGSKRRGGDGAKKFARGSVLLEVGENSYQADVIVGQQKDGRIILYDIISMAPADIKGGSRHIRQGVNANTNSRAVTAPSDSTILQTNTEPNNHNNQPGVPASGEAAMTALSNNRIAQNEGGVNSNNLEKTTATVHKEAGLVVNAYVLRRFGEKTIAMMDKIAKKLGVRVSFADKIEGADAAAAIRSNEIIISKNSRYPINYIIGHEIMHRVKDLSPRAYANLKRTIRTKMSEKLNAEMSKLKEEYARQDIRISEELIMEEAVCNIAGQLALDGDVLKRFINSGRFGSNVLETIRDVIRSIKELFTGKDRENIERAQRIVEKEMLKSLGLAEKEANTLREIGAYGEANSTDNVRYKIIYTEEGTPIMDADKLVPESVKEKIWEKVWERTAKKSWVRNWVKKTKGYLSGPTNADGSKTKTSVDSRNEKIDLINDTRREMTYSEFMKRALKQLDEGRRQTKKTSEQLREELMAKQVMAEYIDEVLKATIHYVKDESRHEHKKIESFEKGKVFVKIGDVYYSAIVDIGIMKNGRRMLYDIVEINRIGRGEKGLKAVSRLNEQWANEARMKAAKEQESNGQTEEKTVAVGSENVYNKEKAALNSQTAQMESYRYLLENQDIERADNPDVKQKYISDIYREAVESYGEAEGIDNISNVQDLINIIPHIASKSPIKIPSNAKTKTQIKNNYKQITFTWYDNNQRFEARWHTRTPKAPKNQGNTWVIARTILGNASGQKRVIHILVGNEWIPMYKWQEAIEAYRKGTSTAEQLKLLENGHFNA